MKKVIFFLLVACTSFAFSSCNKAPGASSECSCGCGELCGCPSNCSCECNK